MEQQRCFRDLISKWYNTPERRQQIVTKTYQNESNETAN